MSVTEASTDRLLSGLQKMVFYDQRFAKQLSGLYPEISPKHAPFTFVSTLVERIPTEHRDTAVGAALQRIVASYDHCPSPKDVRLRLAEGVLKACCNSDFRQFAEHARYFLAFPPKTPEEASSWENQLAFSAVKALTRERFVAASDDEWASVVADVIFGDRPMLQFEPDSAGRVPVVPRQFSELLPKK